MVLIHYIGCLLPLYNIQKYENYFTFTKWRKTVYEDNYNDYSLDGINYNCVHNMKETNRGYTVLHHACKSNTSCHFIRDVLIYYSKAASAKNSLGQTPLHMLIADVWAKETVFVIACVL